MEMLNIAQGEAAAKKDGGRDNYQRYTPVVSAEAVGGRVAVS